MSIYDVYGPCDNSQSSGSYRIGQFNNMTLEAAAEQIRAGVVLSEPLEHYNKRPLTAFQKQLYARLGGPDACIDAGDLPVYLNSAATRQALNVVDIPWTICTGNISYTPTEPDERNVICESTALTCTMQRAGAGRCEIPEASCRSQRQRTGYHDCPSLSASLLPLQTPPS